MAYPLNDGTRAILQGDFAAEVSASAWLDGVPTVPDLGVVSWSDSQSLDGQLIRSEASLTVDDSEGRLSPLRGSDPLAPYGAQITASVQVSSAPGAPDADTIPVGRYLLASASPEGGWYSHQGHYLPSGGDIQLALQDVIQDLIESEIVGLMQPKIGASVASEVQRLCDGVVPVDVSGIPASLPTVKRGLVYESNRLNNIMALLRESDVVARASRDGVLEFIQLPTTVSKLATAASGNWGKMLTKLDRDGVVNTVIATSDAGESRVMGIAQELTGPLSAQGPLGPRVARISSPNLYSNSRAQAAAEAELARIIAARTLPVEATIPHDPSVDAGDLHRITLIPGELEPTARVVRVSRDGSAQMQITYSVARSEVEAWVRRNG